MTPSDSSCGKACVRRWRRVSCFPARAACRWRRSRRRTRDVLSSKSSRRSFRPPAKAADWKPPAAGSAESAAARAQQLMGNAPRQNYDIGALVKELTRAAEAVRALASYLEENPDALLKGRK